MTQVGYYEDFYSLISYCWFKFADVGLEVHYEQLSQAVQYYSQQVGSESIQHFIDDDCLHIHELQSKQTNVCFYIEKKENTNDLSIMYCYDHGNL